jgi:hypothetical protein
MNQDSIHRLEEETEKDIALFGKAIVIVLAILVLAACWVATSPAVP